ncbi:hypothetical protein PIB30_107651, partial [Stylosanthes scabra]|nr:hypothetical protein [Stylosanthes scabra]
MGTIPTSPWYYLNDSVHLPRSLRITERSSVIYLLLNASPQRDPPAAPPHPQ